ncbi:MAG: hypothetical protein ACP5I1_18325, partial [Candidatus Hinthialibacter sp.]
MLEALLLFRVCDWRIAKTFICLGVLLSFFLWMEASAKPPVAGSVESWTALEDLVAGMVLEPDGSLLALENYSGELSRLRLGPSQEILSIETVLTGLVDPIAMARSEAGDLYIAERGPGRIWLWRDGALSLWAEGLRDISSIRLDGEGNVWASEMAEGEISVIDGKKKKEVKYKKLD